MQLRIPDNGKVHTMPNLRSSSNALLLPRVCERASATLIGSHKCTPFNLFTCSHEHAITFAMFHSSTGRLRQDDGLLELARCHVGGRRWLLLWGVGSLQGNRREVRVLGRKYQNYTAIAGLPWLFPSRASFLYIFFVLSTTT